MSREALELLSRTLASPNDEGLLEELRRRSGEVRRALDAADGRPVELTEDFEPAWVARVFEAIADGEELPEDQLESVRALIERNQEIEVGIGRAFQEELLIDLPGGLRSVADWFQGCPPVSNARLRQLLEDPVVAAGGEEAAALARYDITPYTLFLATKATSALTRRLIHRELLPPSPVLEPEPNAYEGHSGRVISLRWVLQEIHGATGCRGRAAPAMHRWLVEVGSFKPRLYPRFECQIEGRCLVLRDFPDDQADIHVWWGTRR
jgi:hypothetical protein